MTQNQLTQAGRANPMETRPDVVESWIETIRNGLGVDAPDDAFLDFSVRQLELLYEMRRMLEYDLGCAIHRRFVTQKWEIKREIRDLDEEIEACKITRRRARARIGRQKRKAAA
jgi:hypothetical protein